MADAQVVRTDLGRRLRPISPRPAAHGIIYLLPVSHPLAIPPGAALSEGAVAFTKLGDDDPAGDGMISWGGGLIAGPGAGGGANAPSVALFHF